MQKYFISTEDLNNKIITGDDVFHIKNVMRSRIGDLIMVCDQKSTFIVKINNISNAEVSYEIVEEKIGKTVEVEIRLVEDGRRFEDSFVDIEKFINMDLTIED